RINSAGNVPCCFSDSSVFLRTLARLRVGTIALIGSTSIFSSSPNGKCCQEREAIWAGSSAEGRTAQKIRMSDVRADGHVVCRCEPLKVFVVSRDTDNYSRGHDTKYSHVVF